MTDSRVWLSRRALKLHVVILIVVPGFMALCLWQLSRALGGNTLSWAYVFEWPLFAGYAVYMWWRLLHEGTEGNERRPRRRRQASEASVEDEEEKLAEYNRYLAELHASDRARQA